MNEFGLDERATCLMRAVFEKHPRIAEVRVFGSRARGNFAPESDVDFALFGDVDARLASRVASELDELPLPYRFDVQAYPCVEHRPLRDHIDLVGKPFFVAALH
jgi:predicted nucleotidyltransferase